MWVKSSYSIRRKNLWEDVIITVIEIAADIIIVDTIITMVIMDTTIIVVLVTVVLEIVVGDVIGWYYHYYAYASNYTKLILNYKMTFL